MTLYIKNAGVWKQATPYAKVAGVWKLGGWYAKVAGVWKLINVAAPSDHTLTPGQQNDSSPPFFSLFYTGYSNGSNPTGTPAIGSFSPGTFLDSSGSTRTVVALVNTYYLDDISESNFTQLALTGSVPNTNDTFQRINIAGVDFVRTDAGYEETGGYSIWTWEGYGLNYPSNSAVRILFDASQS